jgi:hypothetical protein
VVNAAGPIGRVPAQRLARSELAKAVYHNHSVVAILRSVLSRLFEHVTGATPGGWWSLVALAALLVLAVAAITFKVGPPARTARHRTGGLHEAATAALTAQQLRDLAASHAARDDFSTAILYRVRAIAVALEERGVLLPDAGRTADEMAAQAAVRYPALRDSLTDAASVFDRIRYGNGTGSMAEHDRLRSLDEDLAERKPVTEAPA